MTLAWAWSPQVNIRAKYEITSGEFSPRGGQILLSHSKGGVLFHPHHRARHPLPSLPSYERVPRLSVCKSQPLPSHPNRGLSCPWGCRTLSRCSRCVEPPWPIGKRSDPSDSLRFQLPPCFLVLCSSKKLFVCTLTIVARPLLRRAQREGLVQR